MSQTVQAIQLRVGNELLMNREDGEAVLARVTWVSGEVIYTGETMVQIEYPSVDGRGKTKTCVPLPSTQMITLFEAFVTGENR